MVRYRAASAMAPIPFDRHGVPGTIELVDDFVTFGADVVLTSTTGAVQSDLDWQSGALAVSSGLISIKVAESDHQGIVTLATVLPTSSTDCVRLNFGRAAAGETDEAFFLDTNGLYIATILRIPSVTATDVSFGLMGVATTGATELPSGSSLDYVGWTYDNTDTATTWIAQVNGAGTDVEQAAALTYVANDWVLLEIAADTSGVTFRITTEDDTETITLNSADGSVEPVVALRPAYVVSPGADGAAGTIDIDLFVLRYIRRQSLVSAWLGQ